MKYKTYIRIGKTMIEFLRILICPVPSNKKFKLVLNGICITFISISYFLFLSYVIYSF